MLEVLADQIERLDKDIGNMTLALNDIERSIVAMAMAGVGGAALNGLFDQRERLVQALAESRNQREDLMSTRDEWQQIYDNILEFNRLYGEISTKIQGDDRRVAELEQTIAGHLKTAMEWNGKLRELAASQTSPNKSDESQLGGNPALGSGQKNEPLAATQVFLKWVIKQTTIFISIKL